MSALETCAPRKELATLPSVTTTTRRCRHD